MTPPPPLGLAGWSEGVSLHHGGFSAPLGTRERASSATERIGGGASGGSAHSASGSMLRRSYSGSRLLPLLAGVSATTPASPHEDSGSTAGRSPIASGSSAASPGGASLGSSTSSPRSGASPRGMLSP
jgi:hypothetical protein